MPEKFCCKNGSNGNDREVLLVKNRSNGNDREVLLVKTEAMGMTEKFCS